MIVAISDAAHKALERRAQRIAKSMGWQVRKSGKNTYGIYDPTIPRIVAGDDTGFGMSLGDIFSYFDAITNPGRLTALVDGCAAANSGGEGV